MAYTGTYEQELRKNPTDYKLRAMGKRKYQLLQKEKGGKVSVTRVGKANMPGDFGVGKEREIERSNVKSLLRQNLKKEMDKIKRGEPLGEKQKDAKSQDTKKSINTKGEPKTRKEFGVGTKRVIDESGRKSTTESKSDDSKSEDKDFSLSEIITTGLGGTLVVGIGGDIARRVIKGRKARKFAEARTKRNLANLKKNDPSKYQKVMKSVMEKLKKTDARGQTKPDLKKKETPRQKEFKKSGGFDEKKDTSNKKKNLFQRLKNTVLQKIKQKTTSSTGGRTGAPAGMGTGGTAFGGKDFDGRKKKTIY
jgi:hypothetical protein